MMIRELTINDLPLLFDLFDYHDKEEMLVKNTEQINQGITSIFGLFQNSQLIGELHIKYVSDNNLMTIENQRVYLYAFRIHKDYQNQGLGQLLLKETINILKSKGYSEFTIGVEDDNDLAKHLYNKFHFNQTIARLSETYQNDSYSFNLLLRRE